jgi:4-diphosphocytidyl-2-C-methyl-D-erythritol kinase
VANNAVRIFAPAKINLFLHVGEKRSDGFHALESLAVFVDVGDELAFRASDDLSLRIEGPFGGNLAAGDDNLVLKAARALSATAQIVLTKNLPVASGIGGGSADAAAALRGLNELCGLGRRDLENVAATLGSDVPVCVASRAAWMEGRGEILTPADIPCMPMVLVNPGVAVSTAEVFRRLQKRSGLGRRAATPIDLMQFLGTTANDLEAPACEIQPVIGDVLGALRALPDVRLSRMSGSGATCFAVFGNKESASHAARILSVAHPGWWVRAAKTL